MRFLGILVILAISATLVCEEEKEHEFSSRTQYYLKEYQKDIDRARKDYLEVVEKINEEVVEKLEDQVKRAIRNEDLDEALALKEKIEEIQNMVKRDMLGNIVEKEDEKSDDLIVVSAEWGIPGKTIDVTKNVQNCVLDNSLNIQVHPRKLGIHQDPAPGIHKTLTVKYQLNGKTETISVKDPLWMKINVKE